MSPDLSKKKMADLAKMYDKFIDPIFTTQMAPRILYNNDSSCHYFYTIFRISAWA